MFVAEMLKRDHDLLRSKAQVLKIASTMAPDSLPMLRSGCATLSEWLKQHTWRESRFLPDVKPDHRKTLASLQTVHRHFLQVRSPRAITPLCQTLTDLLDGLCKQLLFQEENFFPFLEKGPGSNKEAARVVDKSRGGV